MKDEKAEGGSAAAVAEGTPQRSRISLAIGIGLMALAVALGLFLTLKAGLPDERGVLRAFALREGAANEVLIAAVQWISWAGEPAQRSLAMVVFAAMLYMRGRALAALIMIAVPSVAGVASSLLAEAFSRDRPEMVPHLDTVTSLSFPSGHAANTMTVYLLAALLVARMRRPLWISLALFIALAVGVSRVLLGVHWPSDVMGGWLWGTGVALVGAELTTQREAAQKAKRSPSLVSRPESGA